jgi:predicted PurR-regulated permease PerM
MAQIAFASFFGALGLSIALPLTVVAKTWIEEVLFKDFLDKWQKTPS